MKYVLGVLGMIVFAIIAIVLFSRATSRTTTDVQTGKVAVNMNEYINDQTEVQFTQYGRVVAEEERRVLRISVSEKERVVEVLKGYEERVEKRKSYPNNSDAYNVFMKSLDLAGFTREKETLIEDSTGVCPRGFRYYYSLRKLDEEVTNLWNSTCKSLGGTLGNNGVVIRELFKKQIPDYKDVVRGVDF